MKQLKINGGVGLPALYGWGMPLGTQGRELLKTPRTVPMLPTSEPLGERTSVLGTALQNPPSWPDLEDTAQASLCIHGRQTEEVTTQNTNMQRFVLELFREGNSAPVFTLYNVHVFFT